ncbi:YjjG family noncanonical pyrimidine nucleotidase [Enterococcus sp. LJL99]
MKTLLFDVDDTLLDFQLAEKKALNSLFIDEKIALTSEIEATYKKINQQLWRDFELGKVDKSQVVDGRFALLFDRFGKQVNGKEMGEKYSYYLSEGHDLLGNSFEILEKLQPEYDLYIVTNGVAKTQYKRLKESKLEPFFKDIFVSEETGFQKPMIEYFDYVFDRIPNLEKEKTMIIGDSLNSDILGGNQAGITTVWLNPNKNKATEEVLPDFEIQQLDELFQVLNHG